MYIIQLFLFALYFLYSIRNSHYLVHKKYIISLESVYKQIITS